MAETQGNDPYEMRRPSSLAATGPWASWSSGTYAYDGAGNIKSIGTSSFTRYDAFNQMTHMTSGTEDWAYPYTADDERLWSYNIAKNSSRWALRDLGGKVLREYLSNNGRWSVGTDYLYRDGLLLAAETQTGQRHYHLDHLGTPRLLTRISGDQAAYHVYYPFGEEATAFNQDTERMKFTGHERDLASAAGPGDDLDYMHARHESTVTGRFVSTDSSPRSILLNRLQTWNRYAYAIDNPLKYTDPSGKLWFNIGGRWTYFDGVNEVYRQSTDKDGNLVLTVIAGRDMFLTFDGGALTLYRNNGTIRTFEAVSGVLDKNGRTQPALQSVRNRGPIPEGRYHFNTANIQDFHNLSMMQQLVSMIGRGQWAGGPGPWGTQRVQLFPDPGTDTHGRGGFFIHGGTDPGSAGCIDLWDHAGDLFSLMDASRSKEVAVDVDYP